MFFRKSRRSSEGSLEATVQHKQVVWSPGTADQLQFLVSVSSDFFWGQKIQNFGLTLSRHECIVFLVSEK